MQRARTLVTIVALVILVPLLCFLTWRRYAQETAEAPVQIKDESRFEDPVQQYTILQRAGLTPEPKIIKPKVVEPPPVPKIALASKALDFAFDHESRSLIALEADTGSIRVYPASYLDGTTKVAPSPQKLGALPLSIVLRRAAGHRFVAAMLADHTVAIRDLDATPSVAQVVKTGLSRLESVAASEAPDDNYVYFSGILRGTSPGESFQAIGRIDLATLKPEILARTRGQFSSLAIVGMSGDGRFMYVNRSPGDSGDVIALGMEDLARSGGRGIIHPVGPSQVNGADSERGSSAFCDPNGMFVVNSRYGHRDFKRGAAVVASPDLNRKLTEIPFSPIVLFRDRPLVAGLRDEQMRFASTWNWQEAARSPFPIQPLDPKLYETVLPERQALFYTVRGFADEAKDRVLVAYVDTLFVVPVPPGLPSREPGLGMSIVGNRSVKIGETLNLRLTPLSPGVTLKLIAQPDGVTLKDGILSWTPNSSQVGLTSATVRLTVAGHSRDDTFAFEAVQSAVELPFPATRMALAPDRKSAVLWGRNAQFSNGPPDQTDLALVDLTTRQVLLSRKMNNPFVEAALDADRVFLALSQSDVLVALNRPELTPSERLFTRFPVRWMSREVGSLLLAGNIPPDPRINFENMTWSPNLALDAANLKPASLPTGFGPLTPAWMNPPVTRPWLRLKEGLMFNGVLFAPMSEGGRPKLLVSPPGFLWAWQPELEGANIGFSPPSPWGRSPANGEIQTQNGQRIGQADQSPSEPGVSQSATSPFLLTDHPVSLTVTSRTENNSRPQRTSRSVIARDLILGHVVETVKVYEEWMDESRDNNIDRNQLLVQELGDRKIVLLEPNRLFVITLDEAKLAATQMPLGIVPVQPTLVASPMGVTKLAYQFRGGQPPYESSLQIELEAVTVDPKTGEISLDGPQLVSTAIANLNKSFVKWFGQGAVIEEKEFFSALDSQAKTFEALVGRPPQGLPLLVPICLRVLDAEGQFARLDHSIFVEVPRDSVEEAYRQARPKPQ